MHVIATAGHVDHGKSALVQALTGTDPDRLAEEHRRGLSIELGYCWTSMPDIGDIAFVDVPGHERFVATMLSGVGPAPAVLFVVAADDPWMPQAAEHLAVLDAFGVAHGVVAVTRSDLADPRPSAARVRAEVDRTCLRGAPVIPVSSRTGAGVDEVRTAIAGLARTLPTPSARADVRLWLDRRFQVSGTGTVVTGTLREGTIRHGDTLHDGSATVRVRGIETLRRPVSHATGVARVALALGNASRALGRGSVLVSPDRWLFAGTVDLRIPADAPAPPRSLQFHIGAAEVACRARRLTAGLVRVALDRPLPLRIGDRAVLRDPGEHRVWGATILDPSPPRLDRRGAAARRAGVLADHPGRPDLESEITRRSLVRLDELTRLGVGVPSAHPRCVIADGWVLDRAYARRLHERLVDLVDRHDDADPLRPGIEPGAAARELDLPTAGLVRRLVDPPLRLVDGRIGRIGRSGASATVVAAVERLREALADCEYRVPGAPELAAMGLDTRTVAAAAKSGLVLRLSDNIVLLPGADARAAQLLARLPQPFTTSQARQALNTSRRVALALLGHLDRSGRTRRLADDRRTIDGPHGGA